MKKLAWAIVAILFAAVAPVRAQYDPSTESIPYFTTFHEYSLSSSAASFSITVPDANDKRVFMSDGYFWCSVAAVITQTLGGTVTGGSALTPVALNLAASPTATAKYGATLTGGSQIGPSYNLAALTHFPLQLNKIVFQRESSASAYKVSTNSISGTCIVAIIWGERSR